MARKENDEIWMYSMAYPKTGRREIREWTSDGMREDVPDLILDIRQKILDRMRPFRDELSIQKEKAARASERKVMRANAQSKAGATKRRALKKQAEDLADDEADDEAGEDEDEDQGDEEDEDDDEEDERPRKRRRIFRRK